MACLATPRGKPGIPQRHSLPPDLRSPSPLTATRSTERNLWTRSLGWSVIAVFHRKLDAGHAATCPQEVLVHAPVRLRRPDIFP